jgi:hypothetical protein
VVTDAVAVEREVVEALRARPETIRLRVVD